MTASIYENAPTWFAVGKNDIKYSLRKNGWIAIYPNGREEIVVAMKNVPEKYWKENVTKVEKAPEVKPEPAPELKDETPDVKEEEDEVKEETPEVKEEEAPVVKEAPKKKSRKKATTEE